MSESSDTGEAGDGADPGDGAAGDAEARLVADSVAFDAGDAALLRAVDDAGSVSGAAATLGRSRARALSRLEALEVAYGPLVDRRRGGADGGGSRLTDAGRTTLARYERLRAALDGTAAADETVLSGRVVAVDGELGRVATPAGAVRAFLADGATVDDAVQVAVRADAVTLQAPTAAPPGGDTSARNRFEGRVVAVDRGDAVARVAVDVGDGAADDATLTALVTVESVTRLGLAVGEPVVATFKATATRATRAVTRT